MSDPAPSVRRVLLFWLPLAATWLMMGIEGPYIAAIIARMADAKANLAAYGVTFSLAFLAEAPIIMVMTASNTLVADRQSFFALRRFVYALNTGVTVAFLAGLYPPFFRFVTGRLMGLPADIASITHVATAILLPWPAAIGYRRFYQGILIRNHMPRRVAYGTVVRVVTMSVVGIVLALTAPFRGAYVGALALVTGVVAEAVASRVMARHLVRQLRAEPGDGGAHPPLTPRDIVRFYYPLALTSLITLAVNPVLTFFLAHSRAAIESLAVMPVVTGLAFFFRSGAIAYQETAVALMGQAKAPATTPVEVPGSGPAGAPGTMRVEAAGATLVKAARGLAAATAICLGGIAYSPLADVWFGRVSGLTPDLAHVALWPLRVLALAPPVDYLLTFQRAQFVLARRTRVITFATVVEVFTLVLAMGIGVRGFDMVGALAAALAVLFGRVAGSMFLLWMSRPQAAFVIGPAIVSDPRLTGSGRD
ncbi:MAG: hypothetical protein ACE148_16915 [Vicinamibacterales bacterium]